MPPDLGQLVGEKDFEQARGVVMECCDCTAGEALALIGAACERTGSTAATVVGALRVQHADVEQIIRGA